MATKDEEVIEPFLRKDATASSTRRRRERMGKDQGLIKSLRQYPRSVFLMLGNELCERFSFYGMKAILMLYFITEYSMAENNATMAYHAFTSLAYLSPLLGSVLADSYFGRFKVILYGSVIYVVGHVLLSFGAVPQLPFSVRSSFDALGLFVIALATGCIKPCVSAFAADQFNDNQDHLREQFFSFFYFAINVGSLFAIVITPILRVQQCMGSEHCFPVAFGVPGILMFCALLLFLAGVNSYRKHPPKGENILASVTKCIWLGAVRSISPSSAVSKPVEHWLDRACPDFTSEMVKSVKGLLNVAKIFGPLVFFWALFDQQGSTWVLQGRRLNGRIGWVTVLPDQINILNPLIVIIMVPIFEAFIYPAARKFVNVTPLRKMAVGGLMTALAFIMAGLLQIEVNKSLELPPDFGNVYVEKIGNTTKLSNFRLESSQTTIPLPNGRTQILAGVYSVEVDGNKQILEFTHERQGYVMGIYDGHKEAAKVYNFTYKMDKTANGKSRVYLMVPNDQNGNIFAVDFKGRIVSVSPLITGYFLDIVPATIGSPDYRLYYGSNCEGAACPNSIPFTIEMGAAHVIHIHENTSEADIRQLVRPNAVSILWLIPQFFVITLGEIMLSVTGLEFAYTQAAPNMKSVLQALWLLTVFAGNVIDMMISGTRLIPEPALEFFFYATLILLAMGVFIILAMRYQYVEDIDDGTMMEKKEKDSNKENDCDA